MFSTLSRRDLRPPSDLSSLAAGGKLSHVAMQYSGVSFRSRRRLLDERFLVTEKLNHGVILSKPRKSHREEYAGVIPQLKKWDRGKTTLLNNLFHKKRRDGKQETDPRLKRNVAVAMQRVATPVRA